MSHLPRSPSAISDLSKNLLNWYNKHHRSLPWRQPPSPTKADGFKNPYPIWLSEIMLQQTTVEAVKAYYIKFVTHWPSIFSLAQESEENILKAWAGLGYYSRARNLKKCAELIAQHYHGFFPATVEALKRLPGIGAYTAGAICAIAFNQAVGVVDANVARILSRLFMLQTPLGKDSKTFFLLMENITPAQKPGDFVQAMMDLGALICTPKNPRCSACPIQGSCAAYGAEQQNNFPKKLAKRPRPEKRGCAFVIFSKKGEVFLQKRPSKGLLAGMTEVPLFMDVAETAHLSLAPFESNWHKCGQIHHVFTHFRLIVDVYRTTCPQDKILSKRGWWAPAVQLTQEALPTLIKKTLHCAGITAFR